MRFWLRVFGAGFGAGALAAAGQLGVVYGLGMVKLDRNFANAEEEWALQLTWIAFFTLVAVVAGAAFAVNRAKHVDWRGGVMVRVVAAVASGLGVFFAMVPLTVYPAINAKLSATIPAVTVGILVTAAVASGIALAALTVAFPPMSTSLIVFTVAAWVLAIVSFVDSATWTSVLYLERVRLGVLDIGALQPIPRASFSMPALAVALGIVVALTGHLKSRPRIQVALSGAAGPLLIAIAYLLSGPGPKDVTYQADAYLGAMIAVVAGLIPAAIIAFLPRPASTRYVPPRPVVTRPTAGGSAAGRPGADDAGASGSASNGLA